MKNLALIIILALATLTSCSLFHTFFKDEFDPGTKMAYKICGEISQEFKNKYNFRFSGIWEVGPNGKYELIGLKFNYPKLLTKEEGRVLLLKCAKKALEIFNSHPEFEEHMNNVPFTYNNLNITIFVHPSGNSNVYAPNVSNFSLLRHSIDYTKKELVGDRIRYTSETETLEEAMQIVGKNK